VLPADFCWIRFQEVLVGPICWLAGHPSVRRQVLKKRRGKRVFPKPTQLSKLWQNLIIKINKQNNLFYLGEDESFMTTTNYSKLNMTNDQERVTSLGTPHFCQT
jgi:hypothetical protein